MEFSGRGLQRFRVIFLENRSIGSTMSQENSQFNFKGLSQLNPALLISDYPSPSNLSCDIGRARLFSAQL